MDNTLKFYLLAEIGGWDTSAYAFKYRSSYSKSKAYQVLSYNVLEAKNHLSKDAQDVVKEFENLKIEPRSLSEAFVLETKINYQAWLSAWYAASPARQSEPRSWQKPQNQPQYTSEQNQYPSEFF